MQPANDLNNGLLPWLAGLGLSLYLWVKFPRQSDTDGGTTEISSAVAIPWPNLAPGSPNGVIVPVSLLAQTVSNSQAA